MQKMRVSSVGTDASFLVKFLRRRRRGHRGCARGALSPPRRGSGLHRQLFDSIVFKNNMHIRCTYWRICRRSSDSGSRDQPCWETVRAQRLGGTRRKHVLAAPTQVAASRFRRWALSHARQTSGGGLEVRGWWALEHNCPGRIVWASALAQTRAPAVAPPSPLHPALALAPRCVHVCRKTEDGFLCGHPAAAGAGPAHRHLTVGSGMMHLHRIASCSDRTRAMTRKPLRKALPTGHRERHS